jgi:alginate O-acetyltransferase complex protein AlgJ
VTLDDRRPVDALPPVHEAWLPREHSLHRPRHGGRQLTALLSALVFFTTPTFMWLFGMRPAELENHVLAGFPSVWDGWDFLTGMDPWATENLVFRADAIQAADWVSRTFFGEAAPFDQGTSTPSGPLPGSPGSSDEDQTTEPDNPANEPDAAGYRRVIEGGDGWLYLGQDVIAKCQPTRPTAETVRQLAKLRDVLEASGREFVLVAVPDKTTMVPENLPDTYAGKDCAQAATPNLWRQLSEVAGAIDMRPPLEAATEELGRPVYFPMDSHWTNEGALMMVRQVAERLEPGISESWKITERATRSGTADLPPLIGRNGTNEGTVYRLAPDGEDNRAARPLGDLREPVRRTSEPVDGMIERPTLLLGDSFSLPASGYLPAAFSDVTQLYYSTIDPDPALVARTMADNEVVVLEIVERNIARGSMSLLDDSFLDLVRKETQNRPIR